MHQSPAQNPYFSITFIVKYKFLSIQNPSRSHPCSSIYWFYFLNKLFAEHHTWAKYQVTGRQDTHQLCVCHLYKSYSSLSYTLHSNHTHMPNHSQNWPLNFQPLWFRQMVPPHLVYLFPCFLSKSSNPSNFSPHAAILSCISWYLLFRSGPSLLCTSVAFTAAFLLLDIVGQQNLSPQTVSLWYED